MKNFIFAEDSADASQDNQEQHLFKTSKDAANYFEIELTKQQSQSLFFQADVSYTYGS
jgi:hypothetical protein